MTAGELFEDGLNKWRDNKGVGCAFIPYPLNDKILVLAVLQKVYSKTPNTDCMIVVNDFKERSDLIEFLLKQEDEENNEEFRQLLNNKKLKVYTSSFFESFRFCTGSTLCIIYHPSKMVENLRRSIIASKFKLVVLNRLMEDANDMSTLYSLCPLLPTFEQNVLDEVRTATPVEDVWINVTIPDNTEDYKLLEYYNNYINTSISIFGTFELLEQARTGNKVLNISANEICDKLAKENGWHENLDMNSELNIQIDELYNPGAIRERASKTYEFIRNRNELVACYKGKLDEIYKIVEKHDKEKILIINKYADFAKVITDGINLHFNDTICGNYHDKLEPIPALHADGTPILYKSGNKKGQPRYLASKAQCTENQKDFDMGYLRILSTNNAPNKELYGNVDVIIITSPLCESIKSYMYRLSNIRYPNNKLKLYSIFIKNSLEEKRLQNKELANNHTVVNKCEINVVSENNSDFIIVD